MKINFNNYEEYMLSFVDKELNEEEAKELKQFFNQHPELRHEMELLQATSLSVDDKIIFPDKNLLYRKEEAHRQKVFSLIRHRWLSAASAACLLLLVTLAVHPWKEQAVRPVIAFNALPVQNNKASVSAPVDSPVKEIIQENQVKRRGILAEHQVKNRNIIRAMTKKGEGKAVGKTQPGEKTGPVPPVTLPGISSLPNESGNLASDENHSPEHMPLGDAIQSVPTREIIINKNDEVNDDKALTASAKSAENENIVQKVEQWKKKPAEILENIHRKGIKIGKTTFAFNN